MPKRSSVTADERPRIVATLVARGFAEACRLFPHVARSTLWHLARREGLTKPRPIEPEPRQGAPFEPKGEKRNFDSHGFLEKLILR
jgi:hypothetical protein